MEKSKIYTKTGDRGQTSLVGGKRVSKYDVRLEAYGTVDELNSYLGMLIATLPVSSSDTELLQFIQNKLFVVGSYLATDTAFTELREASRMKIADVERIERVSMKLTVYCHRSIDLFCPEEFRLRLKLIFAGRFVAGRKDVFVKLPDNMK